MSTKMTEAIAKTLSTFTESGDFTLDDFIVFQDIDAEHIAYIDRYETLRKKTTRTTAEDAEMTTLMTELEEYMPTSATWNQLCACMLNLEAFFRDGLVIYIKQKQEEFKAMLKQYKYMQEWNSGTSYYFGNLVSHNGYGFLNIYSNDTNDAVNLNHEPDTTKGFDTYWARFTIKGDKGDVGLNVDYKGEYNPSTTYTTGDACSLDGVIYYAKQSTTGNSPTDPNYWVFIDKIYINSNPPSDTNLLWMDTSNNRIKRYTSNNKWEASVVVASEISITDTNGSYGSTTVDGALDEIGKNMIYNLGIINNSSNVNVLAVTNGGISSYTQTSMLGICLMLTTATTGACTINISSLGAKNLLDGYGNAFSSINIMKANVPYQFRYNGTNFILSGKGGGGTASDPYVLAGYTYTNNNGMSTGTMINNNIPNTNLPINGSYTIPKGYHPGTEIVNQSIPTRGATNITPSTTNQVISAGQYLTGDQNIVAVGGTANPPDVVAGKSFCSASGINQIGTATIESLGGRQYVESSFTHVNGTATTITVPFTARMIIVANSYSTGWYCIPYQYADTVFFNLSSGANAGSVPTSTIQKNSNGFTFGATMASGTWSYKIWG